MDPYWTSWLLYPRCHLCVHARKIVCLFYVDELYRIEIVISHVTFRWTIMFPLVVMNSLLVTSCDVFKLQSSGVTLGSLGLFEFNNPLDTSNECVAITDIADREIEDKALLCARISALMALGFGGVLILLGVFKQCIVPFPATALLMDVSAAGVQICLALVYVLWMSEACTSFSCVYGQGLWYLLAAQVAWLVVGCCARCMRDGRNEQKEEKADTMEA